jgi:hypothetical protein
LKQRDLRNLNLGDLKKGPKGAEVPPHKKKLQDMIKERIHKPNEHKRKGYEEDEKNTYHILKTNINTRTTLVTLTL